MSTNPFDDEDGLFVVLRNDEGQYSLWPIFADVPGGWTAVYGAQIGTDRNSAVRYIEDNWVDMRPQSLRAHMDHVGDSPNPIV
ncbi:MbtH family protein [Mycolicibacterium neoaurum]|uniref:MbtH family protein n=1 Tax=Mycolicibacterium neoaurum TaxID=1795 RepID=UPI001F4D03BA|nr:MbtH family NRPS accessory protein [Mycolicibacterium neoaurum]